MASLRGFLRGAASAGSDYMDKVISDQLQQKREARLRLAAVEDRDNERAYRKGMLEDDRAYKEKLSSEERTYQEQQYGKKLQDEKDMFLFKQRNTLRTPKGDDWHKVDLPTGEIDWEGKPVTNQGFYNTRTGETRVPGMQNQQKSQAASDVLLEMLQKNKRPQTGSVSTNQAATEKSEVGGLLAPSEPGNATEPTLPPAVRLEEGQSRAELKKQEKKLTNEQRKKEREAKSNSAAEKLLSMTDEEIAAMPIDEAIRMANDASMFDLSISMAPEQVDKAYSRIQRIIERAKTFSNPYAKIRQF